MKLLFILCFMFVSCASKTINISDTPFKKRLYHPCHAVYKRGESIFHVNNNDEKICLLYCRKHKMLRRNTPGNCKKGAWGLDQKYYKKAHPLLLKNEMIIISREEAENFSID